MVEASKLGIAPGKAPNSCCGYLCGRNRLQPYSLPKPLASKLADGISLRASREATVMRTSTLLTAAAALLAFPVCGWSQDQGQTQTTPPPAASGSAQSAQNPPQKPDPIVEAARRSREQKKETTKPAKVFDNDNISGKGGVSYVGETTPAPTGEGAAKAEAAAKTSQNEEKTWRERFAKLRQKLQQDQAELDIMQR